MTFPNTEVIGAFIRNAVAVVVVALTVMGVILFGQVRNDESQIKRSAVQSKIVADSILKTHCDFFYDLGTAPLIAGVVNGKPVPPSRLGVKIVIDSRRAYEGEHLLAGGRCARELPPPSPTLIQYARLYGLTIGN